MCKKLILLGAFLLGFAQGAKADDQTKARALVEQAIQAHGGEAALGKFIGASFKLTGHEFIDDKKLPKNIEVFAQGDDKMRLVFLDPEGKKPTLIEVIDGETGWIKEGAQEADEIPAGEMEAELDDVYLNWATMLVPLKKDGVRLSTVKDETVDGRKLKGILIKADKRRPFKFYFDAKTHLLVMCETISWKEDAQSEVVERTIWSDFQDVQGTKQPLKLSVLWDGAEVSNSKIADLKFYETPLDKKFFEKP